MKKIMAIILAAALCVSLTACGEIQKAEKSVNDIFSAVKSADLEKMSGYADIKKYDADDIKQVEPIIKALAKNFDYKIISSEQQDNNTVTVNAEITVSDLSSFFKDYMQKAMEYTMSNFSAMLSGQLSEEEQAQQVQTLLTECLENADLSNLVTEQITINVVKGDDNKWKPQIDEAVTATLFKGMFGEMGDLFGNDMQMNMGMMN